jgi:hypothetical protein
MEPDTVSQVRAAVSGTGPNGPSVTTSASTIDPTLVPPTGLSLQLSPDGTSAMLQWIVGDASKATVIEASIDGGRTWFAVGSVASGVNSATITGINPITLPHLSFRLYTASGTSATGGGGAAGTFSNALQPWSVWRQRRQRRQRVHAYPAFAGERRPTAVRSDAAPRGAIGVSQQGAIGVSQQILTAGLVGESLHSQWPAMFNSSPPGWHGPIAGKRSSGMRTTEDAGSAP